jgi:hypothetical protein
MHRKVKTFDGNLGSLNRTIIGLKGFCKSQNTRAYTSLNRTIIGLKNGRLDRRCR